jgi:PelA/Pel-15E family pectate lyase
MQRLIAPYLIALVFAMPGSAWSADANDASDREARDALRRAAAYFESISTRGGYLWWYSEDLKQRAGENPATETQIWVQSPGTPSVGLAFLRAYEITKEPQYLNGAQRAAEALAWGQLESGGWTYLIDFDPANPRTYRRAEKDKLDAKQIAKRRNVTTFDDDTTQQVLRFLMKFVGVQTNASAEIRSALDYGLAGLLRAQYPNGAWPQGFDGRARDASLHQPKPARFPEQWSRTPDVKEYWHQYTFNDNSMRDCIRTLIDAHRQFGKPEYLAAAKRAGDLILVAQLPAPQRAWAQQYNTNMEPAWARRFEPPSVCSGESAGVLRILVELHAATGDRKYLEPLPSAIEWLKRSEISPGQWARFYELQTNKPLYFTKDYRLVYADDDLPTHYGFLGDYGIPSTIKQCEAALKDASQRKSERAPASRSSLEPSVRKVIDALDAKGRWITNGRIESRTFIANVNTLCDYLEAR